MTRIGVVGLGQMGLLHAAILNSITEGKVVLCDSNAVLLRFVRRILPEIPVFDDIAKLSQVEDLQAVYICTPLQTHLPITRSVLQVNKNLSIFVEKPLAQDYKSATEMSRVKELGKGISMVGFQKRYEGVFRELKKIISSGVLGSLIYSRSHFYTSLVSHKNQGWKFQQGSGGVILEFSPHILDMLIWLFGEPKIVTAISRPIFSESVEDVCHVVAEFPKGLVGYIDASWSMRNFSPAELMVEVHGTNGYVNVTEDRLVMSLDSGTIDYAKGNHVLYAAELTPPLPVILGNPEYFLEDSAFVRCLESNSAPEADFAQGVRVNKLIENIKLALDKK